MGNYKEKNMALLHKFHPALFKQIKDITLPCPGIIEQNSAGDINLRFTDGSHLHNFTSPWQEANEHLTMLPNNFEGIALFCGLGLGYWPLQMLAQGHSPALTIIIEPSTDIFLTALDFMDLSPLISNPGTLFFIGDINWQEYEAAVTRTALFETTCFFRSPPDKQKEKLYKEVDDKAFSIMNSLNIQGATMREKGPVFFYNSLRNISLLHHSPPINCLQGLFQNKPAIIVSAGPSLNNDLEELRKIKDKCVVIAVDSAAKPLFEANINPDFITSIDFQELNIEKVVSLLGHNLPTSLVSLIKASPAIPKNLNTAHTFLAFQDDEQDTWLPRVLGVDCFVSSGSSVALLSLGLARLLGASPICFLGQDLSFGEVGSDHAQGTVFYGSGLPKDQEILTIPGIGNSKVKTNRCFLEFLNQFEQIIQQHPNKYLNLTSQGARIHGTEEMSLSTASRKFFKDELQIKTKIDRAALESPPYNINLFLDNSATMLKKIRHLSRHIEEIKKMVKQEINISRKNKKRRKIIQSMNDLSVASQKNMGKIDRLNRMIDSEHDLWLSLQTVSLDMFYRNQKALAANQKLQNNGDYSKWLLAELTRLKEVNDERNKILTKFQSTLMDSQNHLKKVGQFTNRDYEHKLTAASLYIRAGDIALAAKALDRYQPNENSTNTAVRPRSYAKERGYYYLLHGIIMANFLNLEQANHDWETAASLDSTLIKEINKNRIAQAHRWCKNMILEFAPNLMEMWLDRIVLLSQSLSSIEIKEIYHDTIPVTPYLSLFARKLIEGGNFEAGLAVLHDAVAQDPTAARLWEEIGDALTCDNDHLGAMQAYQHCYMAQPHNIDVLDKFKQSASLCAAQN